MARDAWQTAQEFYGGDAQALLSDIEGQLGGSTNIGTQARDRAGSNWNYLGLNAFKNALANGGGNSAGQSTQSTPPPPGPSTGGLVNAGSSDGVSGPPPAGSGLPTAGGASLGDPTSGAQGGGSAGGGESGAMGWSGGAPGALNPNLGKPLQRTSMRMLSESGKNLY